MKAIVLVIAACVIALAVTWVLLLFGQQRGNMHACWEYLNMIGGAKEAVAAADGLTNGQTVAWSRLDAIGGSKRGIPRQCPSGGILHPENLGNMPSCSMHGELTDTPIAFEKRNGLKVIEAR